MTHKRCFIFANRSCHVIPKDEERSKWSSVGEGEVFGCMCVRVPSNVQTSLTFLQLYLFYSVLYINDIISGSIRNHVAD